MPPCCGKPIYPSTLAMVKDLAATTVNAMRMAMRTGELVAPEHMIRERLLICEKCLSKVGIRCTECGCYLSLKTAVLAAGCPSRKW